MKVLIPLLMSMAAQTGELSNERPPVKTNINEVTTLFEDNVQNKDAFIEEMRALKERDMNSIKSKEAELAVPDIDKVGAESDRLSDMKAHELDNAGRDKRTSEEYRFYDGNALEIDHTAPGVALHKQDVKEISDASDEQVNEHLKGFKTADFLKALNDLKFDCKTEKGPIEKEPDFHLEIKREHQENTEYDQFFCEKLRNTYNCHESASITCLKRNWKYFEWKSDIKSINIDGGHAYGSGWLYSIKWKDKRYGMHMRGDMHEALKHHIAHHAGKISGQIDVLNISARGEGDISQCAKKEYRWAAYKVNYRYRDAEEICDQWSEPDLTERCHIK